MKRKYIIRRYNQFTNKWQFLYLYSNGVPHWEENTPYNAHRFEVEAQAVKCLEHGAKDLKWIGTHVIETIYE